MREIGRARWSGPFEERDGADWRFPGEEAIGPAMSMIEK
jgi:hypothetical protein